jgi:hypothetical protein
VDQPKIPGSTAPVLTFIGRPRPTLSARHLLSEAIVISKCEPRGETVTNKRLVSSTNRRPTVRSRRRPRLALACAVSLACHLVAVTLVAGLKTDSEAIATLDGAISVYPNAGPETAGQVESPPPATAPATLPQPARKIASARRRVSPVRRARIAQVPSPPPLPMALTSAQPGSGASLPPLPPRPAQPVHIATGIARSLRIHDVFPRMPELLRLQQRSETVDAQICVSVQGSVTGVRLRGGSATLENVLREAMLTWRYRPLLLQGTPTPFCHDLHLVYRP